MVFTNKSGNIIPMRLSTYIYPFFVFLTSNMYTTNKTNDKYTPISQGKTLYPILISSWKTTAIGQSKFTMTNHKREKLCYGVLEWDLNKNEWTFYYEDQTIAIKNNEVVLIKKTNNSSKTYQTYGFSKLLSTPIETWHEVIPFDTEIEMNNCCYTEFKTNKSYLIIYFQIKPFKLISITFGENKENYILFFN